MTKTTRYTKRLLKLGYYLFIITPIAYILTFVPATFSTEHGGNGITIPPVAHAGVPSDTTDGTPGDSDDGGGTDDDSDTGGDGLSGGK